MPFYSNLVQYFYHLNLKIVHFCYFQNTFPFLSTFRQTDNIRKKRRNIFVEQGIDDAHLLDLWNVEVVGVPAGHGLHLAVVAVAVTGHQVQLIRLLGVLLEQSETQRKEGRVLFNDTLNTFYVTVTYMASDIW